MAAFTTERVVDVRHWSDKLFSFATTRSPGLRFENGQFVMVGLELDGRKLVRAYSIASANHEERLEFFSIKVPDGPLTSRLQQIRDGDPVLVSAKPTGTLLLHDLRPGRRLFLLSTGTGFAPFTALVRDPELYERFEQIVLVRGARRLDDLQYGDEVVARVREHEWLGEAARRQLVDYPCVTREDFRQRGRVTTLLETGRVFADLGLPPLDPAEDRAMVCGSPAMLRDLRTLLDARGFEISPQIGEPGDYVIERAFAEGR